MSELPDCFVIAPIGTEGSSIRQRSDQIFNYVINPVAEACGLRAVRADHIAEPGMISTQILDRVINAPMVVADLTGHNPNVFFLPSLESIGFVPLNRAKRPSS